MILGFAVLGAAIAARKLLPENFAGRAEVVCAVKSCGRDCGSVSGFPGHIGGILCRAVSALCKKGILRIATLQIVQKIG